METFEKRLDSILREVRDEVLKAAEKFASFSSPHEGYAVLLEEVDELWDEVKANRGHDLPAFVEARQVAAMAVRFIADLRGF